MKKFILISSALALAIAFAPAISPLTTANYAFAQAPAKFPLPAGTTLKKETQYASLSGNHYLILQNDGNLIVKGRNNQYIWGLDQVVRNIGQLRLDRVELKPDGSFGAYDAKGSAIWTATGKRVPGAKLNLTDDGVLQLVSANEILWASNGVIGPLLTEATKLPLTTGFTLKKGMNYPSPGGNYNLVFAEDGNLVVKSKNDSYIWGLNQVVRTLSRSSRVELKPDGSFGVYDANGGAIWSASGKRVPGAKLNLTYDGVVQLTSPTNEILWASDGSLTPSIKVFIVKANTKPCTEAGWDRCIEMADPKIKIMATTGVSPSAMNAVANIYSEMMKRLRPTSAVPNPKSKFDGFKVYITNEEPWSVQSQLPVVGTMWKPQTGPMSGRFLQGGASNNFLWISEQMIAKQGVKTRNADGTPDNVMRTFDQVAHEMAHSIDFQLIPDATVNKFTGNGPAVESFALRVQQWFGVPGGSIPPAQEAELNNIFTSRVSFSTEGYKP